MRHSLSAALLCISLLSWNLRASPQDAASAAARADRQDAEERYNRLNDAVEDLLRANTSLKKKIEQLSDEVAQLRAENARAKNNTVSYASQEDVQKLARKLQELDEKRQADRKVILEQIQALSKLPPVPARGGGSGSRAERKRDREEKKKDAEEAQDTKPEKGYEYEVQPNDTLSVIVSEYRKKGVKVTRAQIIKANPTVIKNPNILPVGAKIFIPDTSLKAQ